MNVTERATDLAGVTREYATAASNIIHALGLTDAEIRVGLVRLAARAHREHGLGSMPAVAVARAAAKVLPIDCAPQPGWLASIDADLERALTRSGLWMRVVLLRRAGRVDEAAREELTIRVDEAYRMLQGFDP